MKDTATTQAKRERATTPISVAQFRKAAKAFNARTTATKEVAMQTLVDEGIYTRSGKLSRRYR